jgi:hypothetical protein
MAAWRTLRSVAALSPDRRQGEGSGVYDNRGRYFYLGVRANF